MSDDVDQRRADASTQAGASITIPPELAAVVKFGVRAGREVPGSVALGGSVCALFAHHRESIDIDFVLADLNKRFQERSEEHTSELQSLAYLVCRLLLERKK